MAVWKSSVKDWLLLMMYNNFQCKAIDSVQIGLAEPPNEISNSGHDDHPNACHRPTNKHTSKTSRVSNYRRFQSN